MKRPRSALQRRQDEVAARETMIERDLSAGKFRATRRAQDNERLDVESLVAQLAELYPSRIVRDPTVRRFAFKTHDIGKITLAIATHLYRRYPVGRHLEKVWFEPQAAWLAKPARRRTPAAYGGTASAPRDLVRRRDWYIVAAGGGSLFREHTQHFMTKKETHHFLTVPFDVAFDEAIVFALARSHTDALGLCNRLAKSKLARRNLIIDAATPRRVCAETLFWKDAIRFFCVNPLPLQRIDDLVDYLDAAYEADAGYTLKGRTLASLTAAMEQWHRDLARIKRMGNHSWDGAPIADWHYSKVAFGKDQPTDWTFVQVKTSRDLADEGNEMHHCVYTYQRYCIAGRTSIWSLRARHAGAGAAYRRRITFELEIVSGRIVQVRGFANRRADPDEIAILARWAGEHGVDYDPLKS